MVTRNPDWFELPTDLIVQLDRKLSTPVDHKSDSAHVVGNPKRSVGAAAQPEGGREHHNHSVVTVDGGQPITERGSG